MKHVVLSLVFLSALIPVRSQDRGELEAMLQKIISDSSASFTTYKGTFKNVPSYDSLFHTTITIPGTFNNEISLADDVSTYSGTMAETISEKEAGSLLKQWKKELKAILGKEYTFKEYEIEYRAGRPTKVFSFTKGSVMVKLVCNNLRRLVKRENTCFVHLLVQYVRKK